MDPRILVIGATGLLGRPVAVRLQQAGFAVRVMSRNIAESRDTFPSSIDMAEGDAGSADDVQTALAGCTAVHISIHNDREDECVEQIVEAAAQRRLDRITYVSGTTVSEENRFFPMVERKLRSEEAIRNSGIDCTIFRPGWFMEMLQRFVRGRRAIMFGHPVQKWHFVAVDDFARMVAAAYSRSNSLGKTFFIHGPEAYTLSEALIEYCRVLHPHISSLTHVPLWLLRFSAVLTGNTERRAGIDIVTYLERVGEQGDAAEANAVLGAPEITLGDWLRAQANASGN
jgi:uncharacterized protein YbjT (DUF2867 family)